MGTRTRPCQRRRRTAGDNWNRAVRRGERKGSPCYILSMDRRSETCGLCQRRRPLRDSHLLPAGLYRIIRKHSGSSVAIQDGVAVQTSRQMSAPLLCADCEQTLNRGGENWVLRNCYRGDGDFPLAALLLDESTQRSPLAPDLYKLGSATALRHLTHFGAGVFWRAAARSWTLLRGGTPVRLSLGPYEERLRRFLLEGQRFPEGVYLFVVLDNGVSNESAVLYPPQETERGDSYRHYQFLIPGLFFQAVLGSKVPRGLKSISMQPGGFILVTNGLAWNRAMHDVVADAEGKGRLRQGGQ